MAGGRTAVSDMVEVLEEEWFQSFCCYKSTCSKHSSMFLWEKLIGKKKKTIFIGQHLFLIISLRLGISPSTLLGLFSHRREDIKLRKQKSSQAESPKQDLHDRSEK